MANGEFPLRQYDNRDQLQADLRHVLDMYRARDDIHLGSGCDRHARRLCDELFKRGFDPDKIGYVGVHHKEPREVLRPVFAEVPGGWCAHYAAQYDRLVLDPLMKRIRPLGEYLEVGFRHPVQEMTITTMTQTDFFEHMKPEEMQRQLRARMQWLLQNRI